MKLLKIKLIDFIDKYNIPCYNGLLLFRPNAIIAKTALISYIKQEAKTDNHLILLFDFTSIKTVDISFADEIIFSTKIELTNTSEIQVVVIITGNDYIFNDEIIPSINAAQLLRQDKERIKNDNKPLYLPIMILKDDHLEIMGGFEDKLLEIYEKAINTSGITAREISDLLNISLRNAGTQALKLVKLGLIFRESETGANGKFNIFKKISTSDL